MKRMYLTIFTGALLAMTAAGQSQPGATAGAQASGQTNVGAAGTQASAGGESSASAQSARPSATIAEGTEINAALNTPVDAKKAKAGDQVTAHTTEAVKAEGKTIVPKGAKLVGHITQASARGKGDAESALGIVFDRAILKNGEEVALNGSIRALASAESSANASGTDLDSMADAGATSGGRVMSGGRGALGGVGATAGGAVGAVTNTAASSTNTVGSAANSAARTTAGVAGEANGAANGAVGGRTATGQFVTNSRGVFGLNGLNLNSAGSNSAEGSVITSAGKNVHLDSGTRMLVVAGAEAQTIPSKTPATNKNPKPPKPAAHSDSESRNKQ